MNKIVTIVLQENENHSSLIENTIIFFPEEESHIFHIIFKRKVIFKRKYMRPEI